MDKKGKFKYDRSWMEGYFILFLLIGLWLSLSTSSAFVNYVIITISGLLSGRLMFRRKGLFKFAYVMIIIGFVLGFIFGSYYGNRTIIVILFILANIVSYYLHDKKYINL